MSNFREKAAEIVYKRGIQVDGVTIRELIDSYMEFGELCSREAFKAGKSSEILKTTEDDHVKNFKEGKA